MMELQISTTAPVPHEWPDELARALRIVAILMLLMCWFALVGMVAAANALGGGLLDGR